MSARWSLAHTHKKKSGCLTNQLIGSNCVVSFFRRIFHFFLHFFFFARLSFFTRAWRYSKDLFFQPFPKGWCVHTPLCFDSHFFFFYLLPLLTISFYLRLSSSSPPHIRVWTGDRELDFTNTQTLVEPRTVGDNTKVSITSKLNYAFQAVDHDKSLRCVTTGPWLTMEDPHQASAQLNVICESGVDICFDLSRPTSLNCISFSCSSSSTQRWDDVVRFCARSARWHHRQFHGQSTSIGRHLEAGRWDRVGCWTLYRPFQRSSRRSQRAQEHGNWIIISST